jgi:hypothetical protein
MGKIRRGGYVFRTWVGDHEPRHVHVFRDEKLIVKWDIESGRALKGRASRQLRRLIQELIDERKL